MQKKLSLSTYVFMLLGIFLLFISLAQLVFIHFVEGRINSEIQTNSIFYTQKALEFAASDQFPDEAIIELERRFDSLPQALEELEELRKDKGGLTKIAEAVLESEDVLKNPQFVELIKKQQVIAKEQAEKEISVLRERLKNIELKPVDQSVIIFSNNQRDKALVEGSRSGQVQISIEPRENVIQKYFRYMQWVTLGLGVTSLLFALWLSRHVSRPLNDLALGFDALKQGKFDYRLPPKGVKEVQQTLEAFNETASKLDKLQQMETQYLKQEQLAELGEISRGLAHSLRNPLNTIGLSMEEIAQPNLDEQQREVIAARARAKIQSLDETIKGLMMLTTSGISRQTKVSLNDVITDAVMHASMGESRHIKMDMKDVININGSATELSAILRSLISNAVEASLQSDDITVRLFSTDSEALIQVVDQGSGILSSVKDRLFQPHITTKSEGAGMGLYIAKRILNLHYHGDITLENNSDKGCTATVSLAINKQRKEHDGE